MQSVLTSLVPKFQENYGIDAVRAAQLADRQSDVRLLTDKVHGCIIKSFWVVGFSALIHSFPTPTYPIPQPVSPACGGAFPVTCGCQGLQEGTPGWNGSGTELETSGAPGLL